MVHHGHHHRSNRAIYSIITPSSTPQSIVFPYDYKAKRFSTSSYMPLQTQNRASLFEIEQFLEQVNAPIQEWYDEFKFYQEPSGILFCVIFISMIILPLMPFVFCWLQKVESRANTKLKEASEKAKLFIQDNSQQFIDRGLLWNVPTHFHQWFELWTSLEGPPPQPGFGGFQQQGIQTMSMPQQNYQNVQNMQQNQYDRNNFIANV